MSEDLFESVLYDILSTKYSKSVLSRLSKIDKTKVLMENDSLMKVKSIAECSLPLEHSAMLLTCIKRNSVLKTNFWSSFCVAA